MDEHIGTLYQEIAYCNGKRTGIEYHYMPGEDPPPNGQDHFTHSDMNRFVACLSWMHPDSGQCFAVQDTVEFIPGPINAAKGARLATVRMGIGVDPTPELEELAIEYSKLTI